ncbi:hypothetical protein QK289_15950, partial [Exiguobacterium antarcticum]
IHRNAPETPDNDSLTGNRPTMKPVLPDPLPYRRYGRLYVPVRFDTGHSERVKVKGSQTPSR